MGIIKHTRQRYSFSRVTQSSRFQDTDSNIQNNDYLKQEFICRLGQSGVAYRLQVQFREVLPGDSLGTYNPCVVWNSEVHPWIDVATISLTQPLPDDVTDMTTFDIGRVPEGVLGWPEATGLFDFNAVSHVKRELCRRRAEMVLSAPPSSENIIDYFVHVVTGGQPDAAIADNHCRVYISLIGDTCSYIDASTITVSTCLCKKNETNPLSHL